MLRSDQSAVSIGGRKWKDGLESPRYGADVEEEVGISRREGQYRGVEVGLMGLISDGGEGSRRMKEENEGRKINGR